jgi:hypothetical protein
MTSAISTPALQDTTLGAASDAAQPPPRRRRLWQLPVQAHELLLAMSFTPDTLRRETARALGQMRHGVCILKGSDVDVLYSVLPDMISRNPLSELMHKRLDERHTLAVRRVAKLREAEALRAVWAKALDDDDMPACLWALLTHPLGAALERAALYDARSWVFAHLRRSLAANQAHAQAQCQALQAQQQADELRARLCAQQQQAAHALGKAAAEVARLNGELARLQQPASGQALLVNPKQAAKTPRGMQMPKVSARNSARSASPPAQSAALKFPPLPLRDNPAAPATQPITVHGRRVLCVGGIQHAVARYRGRIEKLGGQFEHHDGGLEDSVQALEGRLSRADFVICQAACINHEAYHRVKRHCERTGTPCVYLDRPSLSRLDRALVQPQPQPQAEHHVQR